MANPAVERRARRDRRQVQIDSLTGLPMRAMMLERISDLQQKSRVHRLAMIYLDLNGFKGLNDTYGHEGCNGLLVQFAKRLRELLLVGEELFRPANDGDEFAVLLANPPNESYAVERGFELVRGIAESTFNVEVDAEAIESAAKIWGELEIWEDIRQSQSIPVKLTCTAGTGRWPDSTAPAWTDPALGLAIEASRGLNQTKKAGSGSSDHNVGRYSHKAWQAKELLDLSYHAVVWMIDKNLIGCTYQPIFDIAGDEPKIVGFEVFADFEQKIGVLGKDSTTLLVRLEDSGQTAKLWEQQLAISCQLLAEWNAIARHERLFVSVNLAPTHLSNYTTVERAIEIVEQADISARQINFEITERQPLPDSEPVRRAIEDLSGAGFGFIIDDLIAGNSSLLTLADYGKSLRGIKIDGALTSKVVQHRRVRLFVAGFVYYGDFLPETFTVTVEGIETAEQLAELRRLGCTRGQGYFLSQKLKSNQVSELLKKRPSQMK